MKIKHRQGAGKSITYSSLRGTVCRGVPLLVVFLSTSARSQTLTDTTIYVDDGVALKATITAPAALPPSGGFPAIVAIHGYGGSKEDVKNICLLMATFGYASLAYTVRGQGTSGGFSTVSGDRERQDLSEAIQFLRTFPSIDPERIGVTGYSQGGIHAWMAAVYHMPGVKAVAPFIATAGFARALIPNGCIAVGLPDEMTLSTVRYDAESDRAKSFIIQNQYDSLSRFIDARDLERLVKDVQIPVLQCLGWADVLFPVNGGIRTRENLSSRGIPTWSYFGTNGHGETQNLLELEYELEKVVSWFDHWLKGSPLDRDSIPLVFYADDRPSWPKHETATWPPVSSGSRQRYYLTGTGLTPLLPTAPESIPFTLGYDTTYTPQMGWDDGYSGDRFVKAFTSTPARFTSPPLSKEIEITGIPTAHLICRGDRPFQADVRLFDIDDSGGQAVWSIISRGAYGVRDVSTGPDHIADFECNALSHIVPAGHRIGVEVTSLDMQSGIAAHLIPFFSSTVSVVLTSPGSPSFIDLPWPNVTEVVPLAASVPEGFLLLQNYPNPFNGTTNLRYRIGEPGLVKLSVYDILGREIATLVDERQAAGTYSVKYDGFALASGVYFCRLTEGTSVQTLRMVVLK